MIDDSSDAAKEEQVLKRDVLGRIKTLPAQREAVLDEFERSGLSGPKFAAVAGIKYPTLVSWIHQRRRARIGTRAGVAKGRPALGWVEAVAAEPKVVPVSKVLRVHLAGGVSLEIANEAQAALAAALLGAWQKRVAC